MAHLIGWIDEIADWDWAPGPVECPGHGPMGRLYHQGVLVAVACGTCGKQPIDLIAARCPVSADELLAGPLEFDPSVDLGSILPSACKPPLLT